jgi:adenylate cyclase
MPWKETSPTPEAHGWSCEPPHDAVRDQLARILASDEFQATDRVRDFLRFIVEETLAGRSDQLKGYTIATAVMDRGDDFDPGQDPIVRIQAGRLRRALERYYLVAGGDDPIVIDVPKGRYVPRFTARGVGDRSGSPATDSAGRPAQAREPAVAVLPLRNLTGNPDQMFLAVGLVEELVTELNRYQDLTVIPCYRALAMADPPADPDDYCRSLGARFLLAGSVRRDAESAKVAMNLIDAATDRQIWAGSFKHSLEAARLIETQERIAHEVVAAIASEHGIISRRLAAELRQKSPNELSTYEALLRYYAYMITASPQENVRCLAALRKAVDREPDYGPAWSALSSLYSQAFIRDAPGFDDPLATGLDYASRGAALEPQRQGSRLVLAYALLLGDDLAAFREEADLTVALNPANPYATGTIGYMKILAGDFAEGRELLDHAMTAQPIHPQWFRHAVYLDHFQRADYEGALEAVRGHDETGFWYLALVAAALGKLRRVDEAAPWLERLLAEKPDLPGRAEELISRSIKVQRLVEDILDGLGRCGMAGEA